MFILGALVGSFLNVVIHRLPIMMEQEWHEQCRLLLNMPVSAGIALGATPRRDWYSAMITCWASGYTGSTNAVTRV